MAGQSWKDLSEEHLVRVLRHLPCILDHTTFSNVCRKWRSVARRHSPAQLPWLLMPSTAASSFFCVASEDTHYRPCIPDFARGARFCGSFPGGWLIVVLPQFRGHVLLNLFTGVRVSLPKLLLVNSPGGSIRCPMVIHAVTLSDAPTTKRPYYAAAIMSSQSNIAFWRPQMNHWAPPMRTRVPTDDSWRKMTPNDPIEDVIYCGGDSSDAGFYVLTNKEDLRLYVPETDNNGALIVFTLNYVFHGHRVTSAGPGQVLARYLVESRKKLLMVVRFLSPENGTVSFDVFVLDTREFISGNRVLASWNRVDFSTLSGRRLFLGRGCSVAVDMQDTCPLCIYFLDDAASFHGVKTVSQLENPYPCSDTGRCNQEIVRSLPRGPSSDCSPWIWFFLSDASYRFFRV